FLKSQDFREIAPPGSHGGQNRYNTREARSFKYLRFPTVLRMCRKPAFIAFLLFFPSLVYAGDKAVYTEDHLEQLLHPLSAHGPSALKPRSSTKPPEDRGLSVTRGVQSPSEMLAEAIEVSSREIRQLLAGLDKGKSVNFTDVQPSLSRITSAIEGYTRASGI